MIRSVSQTSLPAHRTAQPAASTAAATGGALDLVVAPPAYADIRASVAGSSRPMPPPPDDKSQQLPFNIGDNVGSIPSKWLEREPNSRLARILRREEFCPADTEGRPYLEDIQLEDWPAIKTWLGSRLLPEQVTPSLITAVLRYELNRFRDAHQAVEHTTSTTNGNSATAVLTIPNAAAQLLRGQLTVSHTGPVRAGGVSKTMALILSANGPISFCIHHGDGRRKQLDVSIAFGSSPATPLAEVPKDGSWDWPTGCRNPYKFRSATPDHRLMDPLSAVYGKDATLRVTVTISQRN